MWARGTSVHIIWAPFKLKSRRTITVHEPNTKRPLGPWRLCLHVANAGRGEGHGPWAQNVTQNVGGFLFGTSNLAQF